MSFEKLIAGNIAYRFLNITTGIIITILLARLMHAGGYGILSLLIVNASFFNLVSCLGSSSGITYHFASGDFKKGKIFSIIYFIILFQIILLGISELIYFRIKGSYWLTGENELKFILWGFIYLFSITMIDKYTAFLNGSHLYTLANKIIFYSNLVAAIILGGIYFFYEQKDVFFYVQVYIGTIFFQALLLFIFYHRFSKQPLVFSATEKEDWKLFFSYSLIVFITNIIQFIAYRVDYWLINYFIDSDALGLYSLAVRLGQMFWVFPVLFASILFPRMADKQLINEPTKFLLLLRFSNTFSLIAIFITAAFSFWAIPLFFGNEFRNSVYPFLYILPGIFMFGINIILAAYFAGKNKLKVNLVGSSICSSLVLLLDLWFIPLKGIEGAAIASSIAYSLAALYSIWQFTKVEKVPVMSVLFLQKTDWLIIKEGFKKIKG